MEREGHLQGAILCAQCGLPLEEVCEAGAGAGADEPRPELPELELEPPEDRGPLQVLPELEALPR